MGNFGSRPISDLGWAPFFIRIPLSIYFLSLGLWERCRMCKKF